MKTVKGQPITGAKPDYSKKRPLVPNAKDTSSDEQTMIAEAPSPFKNDMQTPQIPAASVPRSAVPGTGNRAPKHPDGGAVGQARMPNQSAQIGGRNGYPPPARKVGSYPSGYKSKRNASFYGE